MRWRESREDALLSYWVVMPAGGSERRGGGGGERERRAVDAPSQRDSDRGRRNPRLGHQGVPTRLPLQRASVFVSVNLSLSLSLPSPPSLSPTHVRPSPPPAPALIRRPPPVLRPALLFLSRLLLLPHRRPAQARPRAVLSQPRLVQRPPNNSSSNSISNGRRRERPARSLRYPHRLWQGRSCRRRRCRQARARADLVLQLDDRAFHHSRRRCRRRR